jgi:hypothetical protein
VWSGERLGWKGFGGSSSLGGRLVRRTPPSSGRLALRTVTLGLACRLAFSPAQGVPLVIAKGRRSLKMGCFDDLNVVLEVHHHQDGSGEARAFLLRSAATSTDCGPKSWLLSLFELKDGSLVGAWSGGWPEDDVDDLVRSSFPLCRLDLSSGWT